MAGDGKAAFDTERGHGGETHQRIPARGPHHGGAYLHHEPGHLKAIGHSAAAKPLLDKAGVVADAGVTGLDQAFLTAAAKRFWAREPTLRTLH